MPAISLNSKGGGETLVSEEDFDHLLQYKWSSSGNRKYVRGWYPSSSGIKKRFLLHRVIMGVQEKDPKKFSVDHRNGNILDNRRENLRVVTFHENLQAAKPTTIHGEAKYRGVSKTKNGKWKASVAIGGERKTLGVYDDPIVAAKVASKFRVENFPVVSDLDIEFSKGFEYREPESPVPTHRVLRRPRAEAAAKEYQEYFNSLVAPKLHEPLMTRQEKKERRAAISKELKKKGPRGYLKTREERDKAIAAFKEKI